MYYTYKSIDYKQYHCYAYPFVIKLDYRKSFGTFVLSGQIYCVKKGADNTN